MSLTATVLLMALATFGLRLLGFLLPAGRLHGYWSRWLRYVPLAVFGTLVGISVPGAGAFDSAVRAAGLGLAAWLLARGTALWLVLALVLGGYLGWRTFGL